MFKRNSLSRTSGTQLQKRQMSLEHNEKQVQQLKLVTHTVISTKFHILTKGNQQIPPTANESLRSSTVLWTGTLADPIGLKKKHLVFKSIEYIISNWSSDQFPSVIYLMCDGVNGYVAKDQSVTTRVAALELQTVAATMDQSQVRTYELRYVNRDPQTWEVPLTLQTFNLTVSLDDSITPIVMPLPNPILLNFEVRRQ